MEVERTTPIYSKRQQLTCRREFVSIAVINWHIIPFNNIQKYEKKRHSDYESHDNYISSNSWF